MHLEIYDIFIVNYRPQKGAKQNYIACFRNKQILQPVLPPVSREDCLKDLFASYTGS
jgi:hypothetical protein